MWLITGGAYQGKLEYALKQTGIPEDKVIDGAECSLQDLKEKPMVNHFHDWVRRMLREGNDINELVETIIRDNPNIIFIVNELGCGIVPVDPFDRNYREITGRICCRLAKNAAEVHRVICGIGVVIKHA